MSSSLISCILVTADRPALCRRALRCYEQQTYEPTELVVLDNGDEPIEHLLDDVSDEVHYLHEEPDPARTIGVLRNRALDAAEGDFVVPQWDDDDWSHPARIERQAAVLSEGGYDACTLPGTLMHVDHPDYFDHPFYGFLPDGVPPTVMHRRDAAIRYPDLRRTSDTDFLNDWREKRYTQLPREAAHLHLRYSHGGNLWEVDHFLRRMRNTPKDFLLYGWYRFVRRDLFKHPRFQLSEAAREAFQLYLEDSRKCGLFADRAASN